MKNVLKLGFDRLISPHERASLIAFICSLVAALYHACVMIGFRIIGLEFMFVYNIISVTVFTITTCLVPKAKSYILLYSLTVIEVIIHQFFADYFLGTFAGFHFFILLMGLLPYLVFENKQVLGIPYTLIACSLFIILECLNFPGVYDFENRDRIVNIFRGANITISVVTILFVIIIYSYVAYIAERILNSMNLRLQSEINLAGAVQQNFFKQEKIDYAEWEIEFYNKAIQGVSGDLYDIYHNENNLLGLSIMDVSGHGISAGLVTMLVKKIIYSEFFQNEEVPLSEIVERINEKVIVDKGNIENYLTGIISRINDNAVEIVNVGHPFPILFRKSKNEIEIINSPKESCGVIGLDSMPSNFVSQDIKMESGDELIFYTDGIIEAKNKNNEQFQIKGISSSILKCKSLPISNQIDAILKDAKAFSDGIDFEDDITIMILKKL